MAGPKSGGRVFWASQAVPWDRPSPKVVCSKAFRNQRFWLDGFSLHCRLGLSDTIEGSLVYYAQERDYRELAQALRPCPPVLSWSLW